MNTLEPNFFKYPTIKDAYNDLNNSLGDKLFVKYNGLLKNFFGAKINKIKFDEEARQLLVTTDQIHLHNLFLLSLSEKLNTNILQVSYPFHSIPDSCDYSLHTTLGLSLPTEELLNGRIWITAIKHGLEGVEENVAQLLNFALKMFLKNIITAMLSRNAGYRIRENNFQHSIGLPVPNPWLRNTHNIKDCNQESNIHFNEDQFTIEPAPRSSLEVAQQEQTHIYSCGIKPTAGIKYTLRSMYETLFHNPQIINNHTIHSINLERILGKLDCS